MPWGHVCAWVSVALPMSAKTAVAQACYAMTEELLARDPYALEAMPAHLAASLELGKKNELFLRSHKYARLLRHQELGLPELICCTAMEICTMSLLARIPQSSMQR